MYGKSNLYKPECTQNANHSELPLIPAHSHPSSISDTRCYCELTAEPGVTRVQGNADLERCDKEPSPASVCSHEPFQRQTGCIRMTLGRNYSILNNVLITLESRLQSPASLRVFALYRQTLIDRFG